MSSLNAPQRYLIVGGSAAGMAAAARIRELDPKGTLVVLSSEPDPPYFRPMIPFCVSGNRKTSEISLLGAGPYQFQSLDLRLNSTAVQLDLENSEVHLDDGSAIGYDRLLIATGSRPWMPPDIANLSAEGVFSLRSLEDAKKMANRVTTTTRAVLLGGGMLNLKTAFALLERGIEVILAVYSPEVLSQLMEPDDAVLIRRALESSGLRIITGVSARRILSGPDGVRGVELDDGNILDCQMVCIGKGVTPNVEWLRGSGLQLDRGVVADRYTSTSHPGVYTAGDVAVTYDPLTGSPMITGLWTNAVEMGRCAGANMAGKKTVYGGTFGILNATQVARMPFVSMGMVHTSGSDLMVKRKNDESSYQKLVFSADGKYLVGAVFVGDIAKAGLYRSVIREKVLVESLTDILVEHRLHYGHLLPKTA